MATIARTTFIKEFRTKEKADKFAKEAKGTVVIKYDYDFSLEKIIKIYWVKY